MKKQETLPTAGATNTALISEFRTSNSDKMGLRKIPFAFTEQGVAMLSAVLQNEVLKKAAFPVM